MAIGYVTARVYTSDAQIPVKDATFSVLSADGSNKLIGVRITDENGKTELVSVDTPDIALSTSPGNEKPFTGVNVRIDHPGFNTAYIEGVQVFAEQVSVQNVELIPTAPHIPYDNKADFFDVNSEILL
ncbi:MAG: spore cortex-lytic protein [Clostridia bacterium]|nr:spore cortex-lytic protein [Clostridia bacterium]